MRLACFLVIAAAFCAAGCSGKALSSAPPAGDARSPVSAGEGKGQVGGMSADKVGVTDAGKNADSRVGTAGK